MTTTTQSLAPGQHALVDLDFGSSLRIVDTCGGQRVQLVCVNRGDHRERFSAPNTMLLNKGVYFTTGSVLYSYYCQPMMTITECASEGSDTLPGPLVDGLLEDAVGRRALIAALGEIGLRPAQSPFPMQLFSHHDLDARGGVGPVRSTSSPGDHIDLRAELDLVVALVNAGGGGDEGTVSFAVLSSESGATP